VPLPPTPSSSGSGSTTEAHSHRDHRADASRPPRCPHPPSLCQSQSPLPPSPQSAAAAAAAATVVVPLPSSTSRRGGNSSRSPPTFLPTRRTRCPHHHRHLHYLHLHQLLPSPDSRPHPTPTFPLPSYPRRPPTSPGHPPPPSFTSIEHTTVDDLSFAPSPTGTTHHHPPLPPLLVDPPPPLLPLPSPTTTVHPLARPPRPATMVPHRATRPHQLRTHANAPTNSQTSAGAPAAGIGRKTLRSMAGAPTIGAAAAYNAVAYHRRWCGTSITAAHAQRTRCLPSLHRVVQTQVP